MAIWQFDFYVISKKNYYRYDESLTFDDNENLLNWPKKEIDKSSIQIISEILSLEKSWSNSIIQYGKIDETCLEFFSLGDDQCSIFIRLSIRNLSINILNHIIEFVKTNKGFIVYNNKCYSATEEILWKLIRESNAYKFCQDPEGFLKSLGPQNDVNEKDERLLN